MRKLVPLPMEIYMPIKITNVFTRANTSIVWPGEGYTLSANNLYTTFRDTYFTSTIEIDQDQLKKTQIIIWESKEKYFEATLSVSVADQQNWFDTNLIEGLTLVKTTEIV